MNLSSQHRLYIMGLVICLMFMVPGMWVPSLPNILDNYDARWVLPYATALSPIFALFSMLIAGALSDRKLHAEKLLGVLGVSGAVFLFLGFSSLEWGWHPAWYLFFQAFNALISGPMMVLMTKIKLSNLKNVEKSFPILTMCGTIGWMSGGWLISWLGLDHSAQSGQIGACIRLVMGSLCFLLPATPPTDLASKGWKAALGLSAFGLLKVRELRAFYVASMLFAIPCVSFYMLVPLMLKEFGSQHPTAQMSIGQMVEVFAMLLLSYLGGRFRIRWFVIVGMSLGLMRFVLFALAGEVGILAIIWLGIALHGPIFACVNVVGCMFLDKRVPDTMRGQAQALNQLLSMSVAGVIGAFACDWLFRVQVDGRAEGWALYWWLLAGFTLIPLFYFCWGVFRESKEPN